VTATKLERRSCASSRWRALGVACLIIGVSCTGCGKDEPEPPAPKPVNKTAGPARKAPRPAAKTPPAAVAEKPAPAAPEKPAPSVVEKPAPAVVETPPAAVVETPPKPVVERSEPAAATSTSSARETEKVVQKKETTVEKTRTVAQEPEPVVEETIEAPVQEMYVDLASTRKPETVNDHLRVAEKAFRGGDCEKALYHFSMARRLEPDDLEVRLLESEACRRCDRPDKALELLRELDLRVRVLESFTYEIAEAHLALDQPGQAAMAWELRYMQVPNAWRAAAEAAQAWLLAGHQRPAQWWFEQARNRAPNTPEIEALETVFQSAALTN
jgi:hypothetical protein